MGKRHREEGKGSLAGFSEAVGRWFAGAFEGPTAVQVRAWEAIAAGRNALVIAPTGSGKTLAAFLSAIDRLITAKVRAQAAGKAWQPGVRVLYVSPLKALGADVDRNLQQPLQAIAALAAEEGPEGAVPEVRTAMRTGDTTPDERRKIVRKPPDILITTPESLYLMLTSQARSVLATVETVIVDEVHALAGSKRGSHLSLSLERLDERLEAPAQRIGLSATVRPPEVVARFLGGSHPVQIIAEEGGFAGTVEVKVPVTDMTAIPALGGGAPKGPRRAPIETAWKSDRALRAAMAQGPATDSPDSRLGSSSIWPHIEGAILDQVLAHRSTIVFVNSRGLCEKLTARLNELYARRQGVPVEPSVSAGYWSEAGSAAEPPAAYRSDIGSSSELVRQTDQVIAKAHHGSVSKDKRRAVEAELKRGELPCVVATSSLELGIDMGQVDLVLQVAPPPSVSSALQRIGRANHQVGGASAGIIFPRTRPEVIDAATVVEAMEAGAIESTRLVRNALDVLAQQTVAAVAMDQWDADGWYGLVTRSACYADLPRSAFDATLAMLAGRMNSGDLAEFSPRILWDRETGKLEARPGSQRLAVTAAGTIPDRGLFTVVLPEGDGKSGRRRVGELDEEMVMESRVGDIIALGTSTWRIAEITGDRVMVEPAPGRAARLPFWHGEAPSRPAELGRARGAFVRELAEALENDEGRDPGAGEASALSALDPAFRQRLEQDGLDAHAQENLTALIALQRQATGTLPTDRTFVVEQCEDEMGDWRVILHSPLGRAVHEPWALAVAARIKERQGIEVQAMAGDDGIVLHFPMTAEELPGAELFRFHGDEVRRTVEARIGSTALFAARFRECAARALLMTPPQPGKRAPLWQQRQKAGRLLEAARREQDFPIMAEVARECLQDVFDMEGLVAVMDGLERGALQLRAVRTSVPSPFAAPLIFGYVGEHLYEGDLPHAERQASLLSVDPALLGELLGTDDGLVLLDPQVIRATEAQLQRTAEGWRARSAEEVSELLRQLGPLSAQEVDERTEPAGQGGPWLAQLQEAHRAFPACVGGRDCWVAADDGPRLHRVLGVKLPPWLPAEEGAEPLAEGRPGLLLDGLVARFARTHGPFTAAAAAERLGLGEVLVAESLERLRAQDTVTAEGGDIWVDSAVLRKLRSRSLAKAREAANPVERAAYERFVLERQHVGPEGQLEGIEGLAEVIAQFEAVYLPAVLWEQVVFPARVADYAPGLLDELVASGEVLWVGRRMPPKASAEARGRSRNRSPEEPGSLEVAFYPADSPLAPTVTDLTVAPWSPLEAEPGDPVAEGDPGLEGLSAALARLLAQEGPMDFGRICGSLGAQDPDAFDEGAVAQALARLAAQGRATSDDFAFVRAQGIIPGGLAASPQAAAAPVRRRAHSRRSSSVYGQVRRQARQETQARVRGRAAVRGALAGRWALLVPNQAGSTLRALASVESLLDRYGLVTADIALMDGLPGGLQGIYPVLRSMEEAGDGLRGLFVEGLGPLQFAARETVDALREMAGEVPDPAVAPCMVIAADDPANLYGAALPWPPLTLPEGEGPLDPGAPKPSRRSGALLVLCAGAPVLYASPHLRHLMGFTEDGELLARAAKALAAYAVAQAKRLGGEALRAKLAVRDYCGRSVLATGLAPLLQEADFVRQPDGLRLYINPL